MHGPQVGFALDIQRNALAHQAAQHLGQFAHHFAQRQSLGLHGLLAAEGQKLADQGCGTQRVLVDLVDFLEGRIAGLVAHQQEFAIADDDGEQVVEVMRHAAGQLADCLHLLRLGELGFQRLLFGDVHQIENGLAGHGAGKEFGHAFFAIGRLHAAQFDGGQAGFAGRGLADQRHHLGAFARLHQIAEILVGERASRAEEFRQRRIGFADGARGIGKGHAHWGVAEQVAGIFHRARRRSRYGCGDGGSRCNGSRPVQDRLGRGAGGQARGEPPGGLLVRQGTHGGDDLEPRHDLEGFLAGAAFAGVPRQAIEHGGRRLARQRQFRRRRGFQLAHARHAAIDGVAVQHRPALAGDGPGDIGLGGGFGDPQGILGGAAAARPDGIDQEEGNQGDADQHRKARHPGLGHDHGNDSRGKSQQAEGDRSPAPGAGRHPDGSRGKGA